MPNSNSEIPVAKKDVAQPAYTASPNPFRQIMNPKTIATKPKYLSIELVVVPFKKSPPLSKGKYNEIVVQYGLFG